MIALIHTFISKLKLSNFFHFFCCLQACLAVGSQTPGSHITPKIFPLSKDTLIVTASLSSYKINPVVLEKRLKLSLQYFFFTILLLSLPWKRVCHSFEQNWISHLQGSFVPSLVKIGQVVLKKIKLWKFTDRWQITDF